MLISLSLEDRMLGRFPPLTAEQEADVRTYYAMLKAQQDRIWAARELRTQIELAKLYPKIKAMMDDLGDAGG